MKKLAYKIFIFGMISTAAALQCFAADPNTVSALTSNKALKVSIVNFKSCVEKSKSGKQEQANFEALKKQMETVLEEKEKAVNEISTKFSDPDYMDSLSPDAEKELKHKYRAMSQEIGQIQGQYYQTLQQANMKILQKLNDTVAKAAAKVAKDNKIDVVLNDDGGFYFAPDLDISNQVIAVMDEMYEKEIKEGKASKVDQPLAIPKK